MKKIATLAVSLLAVACVSTSALAAEQPLEKVAHYTKLENSGKRHEASGYSAAAAAG